ncbi:glycine betaine ABC transporter substrate-binding protein [Prolixibacteraceae bacterium]|nr:glycine betaine ABC transporter substrate-binding protein [Prolixibacteraceae bacterium]
MNLKTETDVVIATDDWSQNMAITQFAKRILESKGYHVKILLTNHPLQELKYGKVDLVLSDWVPQNMYSKRGRFLTVLGDLYNDAIMGVVTPSYNRINSLSELDMGEDSISTIVYTPKFGYEFECSLNEIKKRYGVSFCIDKTNPLELKTIVKDKLEQNEDVYMVGCYPHPMIDKKVFKFIEDPYHAFATKYHLVKVCSSSWGDSHPNLKEFFKNYQFDTPHFDKLIELTNQNHWNIEVAVDQWCKLYHDEYALMLKEKDS